MAAPDMKELMEKAKEMQAQMKKAQDKITSLNVVGQSGGGVVKVTLNGAHEITKLFIDPSLMKPGEEETLEDLIIAAFNDANRKIEQATRDEMKTVAAELQRTTGMPILQDEEA